MDIDPVTGRPREEVREQAEKIRKAKLVAEGTETKRALRSKEGGKLLRTIEKQLRDRIRALMAQDEYCVALDELLIAMHVTVNLPRAVAKEMTDILRT